MLMAGQPHDPKEHAFWRNVPLRGGGAAYRRLF